MSTRLQLGLLALCTAVACSADTRIGPGGEILKSRAGIVDGTTDTADPAIVELFYSLPKNGGAAICTGELIGPQTVLTAGHCADPVNELGVSKNNLKLCTGSSCSCGGPPLDSSSGGTDFCVYAVFVNSASYGGVDSKAFKAGSWVQADTYQYNPSYCAGNCDSLGNGKSWFDNGLFHLSQPILDNGQTTVEAAGGSLMPYNRANLSRFVSSQGYLPAVRYVGFGITSANDQTGASAGTKREVSKSDVEILNTSELEEAKSSRDPGLTCSGDSGGPSLMTLWNYLGTAAAPNVIATTSRGDQTCSQEGIDTRIDATTSFVESFMKSNNELPSCGADGQCGFGCTTPDPDCPCIADGTCNTDCVDPEDSAKSTDPDCSNFALPGASATVQSNTGDSGTSGSTGSVGAVGSTGTTTGAASSSRTSSSAGATTGSQSTAASSTAGSTASVTGGASSAGSVSAVSTGGGTFTVAAAASTGTSGTAGVGSSTGRSTTGGSTGGLRVDDECASCSGGEACANASDVCGYLGNNAVGNCAMSCNGPTDLSCGPGFTCLGIPSGGGGQAEIYACWPTAGACPGGATAAGATGGATRSSSSASTGRSTTSGPTSTGGAGTRGSTASTSTSARSAAAGSTGTSGVFGQTIAGGDATLSSSSGSSQAHTYPANGCGSAGGWDLLSLLALLPLARKRRSGGSAPQQTVDCRI